MRGRIHAHFTELHHERETIDAKLKTLTRQAPAVTDVDLVDELPMLPGRVHELPERIQAALFAALDIQVLWNAPMRQATFFATITDTTPGITSYLLTHTSDDPAPATAPAGPAAATSDDAGAGLARLPTLRKRRPGSRRVYLAGRHPQPCAAARQPDPLPAVLNSWPLRPRRTAGLRRHPARGRCSRASPAARPPPR
jgi:hypothetical protein